MLDERNLIGFKLFHAVRRDFPHIKIPRHMQTRRIIGILATNATTRFLNNQASA
jgi:hypothetical protein